MSETAAVSAVKKLTRRQLILLVIFAIASLGMVAFLTTRTWGVNLSAADTQPAVKPLPVNVVDVKFVDSIMQSRSYTGTIRARRRSDLGFELAGKIRAIFVDEGDQVTQGQVLAVLENETLLAQKAATQARLAQAESVLRELNAGPRTETIKAARASVAASQSEFNNATLNLRRRRKLREGRAISAEEFDQAVFAEKTARANLNAAKQRLAELETGTRQERIDAQKSAVKQLEASAVEMDVAISKSALHAPFAGVVTRRYLDPGSVAPASTPVVKLVEQQHLEAWIGLPVSVATKLKVGSEQWIVVDDQPYPAVVSAKIQELDAATRTQTVVFELALESHRQVVSGQLCEIDIKTSVETSGWWVPRSALSKGIRGLWSVFVIVPDSESGMYRVRKRDVEIIKTTSQRVLAQGTIEPTDQIIVDGVHRIAEGQLVVPANDSKEK